MAISCIIYNMNLSDLTTLKIGGPAKDVITVKTEDALISQLQTTNHELPAVLVIGSGSNLLVSDDGFDGTIIKNEIKGIEIEETTRGDREEGSRRTPASNEDVRRETELAGPRVKLIVKSGTILQDLVDFANSKGLAGLEKLAGIPGTVGGAIYGNAGAYGQTISDHLTSISVYNGQGIIKLPKNNYQFSYRESIFKRTRDIILELEFELIPGNSRELKKESSQTLKKRLLKYPKGIKCPGSFFKNIVADTLPKEILKKIPSKKIVFGKIPAGSLLEDVGAKGDQLGKIKIAPYHANLFINLGGGTAKDFYDLAKKYAEKVKKRFNITLQPEVQFINLPPLT